MTLHRMLLNLQYRWAMANAYLTQFYAPDVSAGWLRDADMAEINLWRLDRMTH